jgi:ATP-dependent helicase/nuclease subunit A
VNANGIPPIMAQARARKAAADEDEDLRLLYVALTRAQSWLIVAAAGKADNPQSWYQLVKSGMQAAGAVAGDGGLQRYAFGDWPAAGGAAQPPAPTDANATLTLPNWALARAVAVLRPVQPFAPSRLSGAKTIGGDTEGDTGALAYGTAVHLLLENLPNIAQAGWAEFAARQCAAFPAALDEAAQVLTKPDLAYVFQGSLAEVPITAPLEKGQMLGVLDRLIVTDTQILAVDFKTNTAVPDGPSDVPAGLLAQMGAYLAALEQIYPARQIDMAILWTKTATLMRLDHDMMREALRRAAIS